MWIINLIPFHGTFNNNTGSVEVEKAREEVA